MERNSDPAYAELKRLTLERTDLKVSWDARSQIQPLPTRSWIEPVDERFDRRVTVLPTPRGDLIRRDFVGRWGQPGYCEEHFLKGIEDCERYLSLPMPAVGGDGASFRAAERAMGDRGIVVAEFGNNPAGAVVELLGSELFAFLCMDARDMVHRLIEREYRLQCALAHHLVSQRVGPCFGFSGEEYITPPLHGRADFFEFNVAYDRRVSEVLRAAGGRIHVHCHGSIASVLDGFIELGADVIHPFEAPPMGNVTPRQAKEALRGRVALEGNIQIADLYTAHPAEIRLAGPRPRPGRVRRPNGIDRLPHRFSLPARDGALCLENYRAMVDEVLAPTEQRHCR